MRVAYFDSSAIVKLIREEPESMALVGYLDEPLECSTSVLSAIEVGRALRRSRLEGGEIDDAMRGFYLLNLTTEVQEHAARVGSTTLRSLDAIHLASALSIGEPDLDFVTYDDRLAGVAREHGLRAVQPGRTQVGT